MNGRKARQLRRLTQQLTPSLDNAVDYRDDEVDVSVVKRMDREYKYEKRAAAKEGRDVNPSNISSQYGTVGIRKVLTDDTRRKYYQKLKGDYHAKRRG